MELSYRLSSLAGSHNGWRRREMVKLIKIPIEMQKIPFHYTASCPDLAIGPSSRQRTTQRQHTKKTHFVSLTLVTDTQPY